MEELNIPSSWQLDSITCTTNQGGGAKTLHLEHTSNSFNLNENEIVTCVFNDSLRTGTVTGDKYEDTNANGTDDGVSDPPIQGWNVYLFSDTTNDNVLSQTEYNAQAATVPSTTTNASGAFTFSNVVAGKYIVCEAASSPRPAPIGCSRSPAPATRATSPGRPPRSRRTATRSP